jgi:uncharacterized protein
MMHLKRDRAVRAVPLSAMSGKPAPELKFDASILADLACPACHGEMRLGDSHLICAGCGREYPIVDGIPVLIADRAEVPGEVSASAE